MSSFTRSIRPVLAASTLALAAMFASAPLSVQVADGSFAITTAKAFARNGADDGAGHVRQGRGADDGAGHARQGRGRDDGPNHR